VELNIPQFMQDKFNAIEMLKDGTKFTASMNKIKFDCLVDCNDPQIAHLAQKFTTIEKRFTTGFEQSFGPRDEDWTLQVKKITSSGYIEVKSDDG